MLSSLTASKKSFLGMATASFVGIMAAIPVSVALFGPDNNANALQDQPASAAVAGAEGDYAQFAYAYTQGYLANATARSTNSEAVSSTPTCSDTTENSPAAASQVPVGGLGNAPAIAASSNGPTPDDWVESVQGSYNTYRSYTYNSSSVHNVNSNNVTGSNNSTSTTVSVEDSLGVLVDVSNESSTVHNQASESFNNDSYNTTTTVSTETNNTAVNSNNNTAIVSDSGNTTTTETNTTIHENSHNTTDIDTDVDVDIDTDIDFTDNSVEDNSENFIRIEEV